MSTAAEILETTIPNLKGEDGIFSPSVEKHLDATIMMIDDEPLMMDVIQGLDRKSTRLNSSHDQISYAVFCLKKQKKKKKKEAYVTVPLH